MTKATDILLTTKDNEFNPFTDYDNWKQFDQEYGYNTEAYVMRVFGYPDADELADDIASRLSQVYEEIINRNNELGFDAYCIITRDGERFDHVLDALRRG